MPANLKEVRIRISSVKSTMQITNAMKMVSAAKLKKATDRVIQIRPYANKLYSVLGNILSNQSSSSQKYGVARPVNSVLIVAVASDRGLCGAFNGNVAKQVKSLLEGEYANLHQKGMVEVMTLGKKSYDGVKKLSNNINVNYQDIFGNLTFANVAEIANNIMDGFDREEYDKVIVVYNRFKNAATQHTMAEQYLPVKQEGQEGQKSNKQAIDFIYEPDQATIVDELVPKILKTQLFRYLLDSSASEHGARMTAMGQATDNAGDLLGELKLSYNRARQAAITTEISEIVSGAAAQEA